MGKASGKTITISIVGMLILSAILLLGYCFIFVLTCSYRAKSEFALAVELYLSVHWLALLLCLEHFVLSTGSPSYFAVIHRCF